MENQLCKFMTHRFYFTFNTIFPYIISIFYAILKIMKFVLIVITAFVSECTVYGRDPKIIEVGLNLFYKVNSLCHSDTGIKTGDFVKIAPQSYAFYLAHKSALLYLNNTRGKVGSPLNNY